MKKTLNLICLAAVAVTLFLLLPYMPPTFFSTLFVVGCMGGLAIWGHILYKPAANSPTLTEEELEELEEMLEDAEGEAVSDNGETVELISNALADVIHKEKQEAEGELAPKIINIQKQEKQRQLANKKRRKRKKKKLAKHSRRQQNR